MISLKPSKEASSINVGDRKAALAIIKFILKS